MNNRMQVTGTRHAAYISRADLHTAESRLLTLSIIKKLCLGPRGRDHGLPRKGWHAAGMQLRTAAQQTCIGLRSDSEIFANRKKAPDSSVTRTRSLNLDF